MTYCFVRFPGVPGSPGGFPGPPGSVLRRFRESEKVGEGWRRFEKVRKRRLEKVRKRRLEEVREGV